MVHAVRAANATLLVVFMEHEMVQDQLAAALEQVDEGLGAAVGGGEGELLRVGDFNGWERTAFLREAREEAGCGLFFGEEVCAGSVEGGRRCDLQFQCKSGVV
jgi:hypothetical protein